MPLTRIGEFTTEGTHISIRTMGATEGRKTKLYEITARADGVLLGTVRWFGRWRKYAFYPWAVTVYEETCLREIAQFIEEETKAHRAGRKKAKMCGHCKHPDHVTGDCTERVCDAAGDIDWCPCSYGTLKRPGVMPGEHGFIYR